MQSLLERKRVQLEVRTLIAEHLRVPKEQLKDELLFADDLGADSLDAVELVIALEQHFDIDLPDEEVAALQTVGDVVRQVCETVRLQ